MPSMSQIHAPSRDIVVLFKDGNEADVELRVTYRPTEYTPRQISKLQEDKNIERISEMTASTVISWDLTDTIDGVEVVVPLTKESLMDVPISIQLAIMKAANADQSAEPEGKA